MNIIIENKRLKGFIVDREEKILELCGNMSVLHLGCADYPYSIVQHKTGKLLHERLNKITKRLSGIDLDQDGINYLTSLGYGNLIKGDVEQLDKLKIRETFDVVVAGELLEHLSNPGRFFESAPSVMNAESVLIITTPNSHSLKRFARALFGRELIHPDHVAYFSPATLEHLCKRYGYEQLECFYYLSEPGNSIKKILFLPLKWFIQALAPAIADGIIFVVKKG